MGSTILQEAAKERQHDPTWKQEATREDVAAARDADVPVSAGQLLARCRKAADAAVPRRAEHEREDLAADLAEYVAARHGWTPTRGKVRHGWLVQRARTLAADRTGWRDQLGRLEAEAVADLDTTRPLLAAASDMAPAVADADAEAFCEAFRLDADQAAAIHAALGGHGSALALADALGISHAAARQRLARGRKRLRLVFPDPAALADALADFDASMGDRDLDPDRPHLDAATRAARWLLDYLAPTTPSPHPVKRDWQPRIQGPEYPVTVSHLEAVTL